MLRFSKIIRPHNSRGGWVMMNSASLPIRCKVLMDAWIRFIVNNCLPSRGTYRGHCCYLCFPSMKKRKNAGGFFCKMGKSLNGVLPIRRGYSTWAKWTRENILRVYMESGIRPQVQGPGRTPDSPFSTVRVAQVFAVGFSGFVDSATHCRVSFDDR